MLPRTKTISTALITATLAAAILLLITTPLGCAAGVCDAEEDFYPTLHYHEKGSTTNPDGSKIDVIYSDLFWTNKSKYFQSGYYFSIDYLRTVSCTNGADKDVYDFLYFSTELPPPKRENVEEWKPWDPRCYVPGMCNEEAELGTEAPQDIQTNRWYYILVRFKVKSTDNYAMRIEPEVEPAGTVTPPPWEEWCLLACYDTKAGSSGW